RLYRLTNRGRVFQDFRNIPSCITIRALWNNPSSRVPESLSPKLTMPLKKKASFNPASADDCPWVDLDEQGTGLSVDDFITTLVVRTGNSLRRVVTLPYSDQFGLTMAEWRMLSVVAEAQS